MKDTGLTPESVLPRHAPPALPHTLSPAHLCLGTGSVLGLEVILMGDTKTDNGHAVESILVSGCLQGVAGTGNCPGNKRLQSWRLGGQAAHQVRKGEGRAQNPGEGDCLCEGLKCEGAPWEPVDRGSRPRHYALCLRIRTPLLSLPPHQPHWPSGCSVHTLLSSLRALAFAVPSA